MSNIDNYKRLLYKSLTMDYEINSNTMSFLKVRGDHYAVSVFISNANFSFKLEIINGCVNVYNTIVNSGDDISIYAKTVAELTTFYLYTHAATGNVTMNYETMSGDIEVGGTKAELPADATKLIDLVYGIDNNIITSSSTFKGNFDGDFDGNFSGRFTGNFIGDIPGNAGSATKVYVDATDANINYNIALTSNTISDDNKSLYIDSGNNSRYFTYNPNTNTLNVYKVNSTTIDTSHIDATTINISSDKRLKENITPFNDTDIINKIKAVDIVNYNYINQEKETIGVLAQDFEEIFPELVSQSKTDKYDDQRSISETKLVYVLWKGMQEQQKMIESLQAELSKKKKKRRWFKKKVSE